MNLVGLQAEELRHILSSDNDQTRLLKVIDAAFLENGTLAGSNAPAVRMACEALQFCFAGFPALPFRLGWASLLWKGLGFVVSTVVTLLICYLVVGALIAGKSDFGPAQSSPILGVALLVILLTILAFVEGSHISIARLQGAKIPADFPNRRVVRLHRTVRSNQDADHFYAGRQILVIFIIFFVSRLTSFPTLTNFPFTSVPLPGGWLSIFTIVFVNYGIAGAIFVYWIGQMLPQLVASKAPTWVLRSLLGEIVARTAKAVGVAGVAAPAELVARAFSGEPDIPPDPRDRYHQISTDNGWNYLLQKKEWSITKTSASFTYEHVVTFQVPGLRAFTDIALLLLKKLNPTPNTVTTLHRVAPGRTEEQVPVLDQALQRNEEGEYVQFVTTASPKWGNFEVGDVLSRSTSGNAAFEGNMEDTFQISFPVQHFVFRCTFSDALGINAPRLMVTKLIDDGVREARDIIELPIQTGVNGDKAFEYALAYPPVGTRLKFLWSFHDG
ncbi:hypothetical protein OM513_03150 [Sphingomonas canadensis]|uniref:hypothetical protein n=1 Tax=Sphingomonas canadensis TaxID=1219257 RepID=UPI00222F21A1|nr:hypothetical protein [Sphingomonas canadensis]MCW3835030.1 hypothetical protein [Sphingomonas canadensis]